MELHGFTVQMLEACLALALSVAQVAAAFAPRIHHRAQLLRAACGCACPRLLLVTRLALAPHAAPLVLRLTLIFVLIVRTIHWSKPLGS